MKYSSLRKYTMVVYGKLYVVNLKLPFIKSSRLLIIVHVNKDIWVCSALYFGVPTKKGHHRKLNFLRIGFWSYDSHDIRTSTKTHKMSSHTALTIILNLTAMELKILLITVLFIGASAAFSLREEQEGKPTDTSPSELFLSFWIFLIIVSFDLEVYKN